MAYQKQIWENLPSTNTPITADRLNHMEDGIYDAYEHGGGGETLPVGSEIDYDGQTVPTGWEQVDDVPEYSTTDEIVCGTWIDGKPIYRKTYNQNSVGDIDVSSLNIDTGMIDVSHSFVNIGGRICPIQLTTTSASNEGQYMVGAFFNNTKTTLTVEKGSALTVSQVVITIEYTKTSS